tara:strand:- start:1130 stop:2338 length:1209 start_codon:yes stop_codon:yes gene_type:complete
MSYSIYAGKQRALIFPVMCNGFLTIDYSDNIPTTDISYGLWDLDENFTFECVLTPYDINGYGSHSARGHLYKSTTDGNLLGSSGTNTATDTTKIMPAPFQSVYTAGNQNNFESELYLPRASRISHEMRIFHSTNLQISLVNSTLHNENNPARYKIKVGIKLGSASMENFITDEVIIPNESYSYTYESTDVVSGNRPLSGFDENGRLKYKKICDATGSNTGKVIPVSAALAITDDIIFAGDKQELFKRDGTTFISLGTINAFSSSAPRTITTTNTITTTIDSNTELYIKRALNPLYINNTYHIACSWDNENKQVLIFLNGKVVKAGTHTQTDSFSMEGEDFYIGANGGGATGANSATTNNQFMGELHELCITNVRRTEFNGLYNLLPNYNNTVLYLRFEEVDE